MKRRVNFDLRRVFSQWGSLAHDLLKYFRMKPSRSFASDNNAVVHPDVLAAISRANAGHVVGYGDDPFTASAVVKFEEHFGEGIAVFFVFNGTAPTS